MPLRLSLLLITLFITRLGYAQSQSATPGLDEKATYALIKRVLPSHAQYFTIASLPKDGDKDAFELESQGGKIVLRGNNGVSVASALKHYLNEYAHCDISWNGTNLNLPSPLPMVPKKVHKTTPYQQRYYLNYCTFNYTMSWWDWPRWQQEIDWMALNGINLPLAITGQNSIWDRVYKSMGLTDKDLASFYSGPTFFNWFWMGNIDGWGGPLPQSFMERHEALQKQILARERELGMTPILPAFTGHVPTAFKDKFPKANVKRTNWDAGFDDVFILDPEDPLFPEIGRRFIQEEIKTFGTDHLYTADTFNENIPPTNDSTFLAQAGNKVYQAMASVDPKAVWIMQGWLFVYQAKFWQQPQVRALLSGVPDDKMLILDLWSETKPAWRDTKAYYGKPWLWCMLQNFGGNIGMFGRMENVANDPANALHDPNAGKLRGIGLTPEGIEQNPALFALMLENVWRDQPIQLGSWLNDYAHRRYGKVNPDAEAAWQILRKTVYNGGLTEGTPESIISARPTFTKDGHRTLTTLNYKPADLLPAWDHFLKAANVLQTSDGFRYDLVDVTRQVLANHANALQQQCARDYEARDAKALELHSRQFLTLIDDMDRLLATRPDFLLGRWLESAKAWGQTPAEKALYEQNARDLITLWGDKNSPLHDYSNRQWSGLLHSFYKPRWTQFFDKAQASLKTGQPLDLTAFDQQMRDWEWNWVNSREPYPTTTTGSSVEIAKALYKQYRPVVNK